MAEVGLTREIVEAHAIDMRQFIDFRHSVLANGMRIVEAYNASGLSFTVLPDRGFDIWMAAFAGKPLTWISQGAPHRADAGASWLRLFNGGLLVTCGLRHTGPPETDERTGERRDLHGDFTRLSAFNVSTQGGWQGDRYVMELTSVVAEAALFGEQLRLTRTVRMTLGDPSLEIVDAVENLYDVPAPFMLLYHFNFGYPLVQAGAELRLPVANTYPRDVVAAGASRDWPHYRSAEPRHMEEVFFHQVRADAAGKTLAVLGTDNFGIQLSWDTTRSPYLTQWKNYRRGIYVCGIEPGNCLPEGQNRARSGGRLVMLEPGETHQFWNRVTVLPTAEAVAAARDRSAALQMTGTPVAIPLHDYVS